MNARHPGSDPSLTVTIQLQQAISLREEIERAHTLAQLDAQRRDDRPHVWEDTPDLSELHDALEDFISGYEHP